MAKHDHNKAEAQGEPKEAERDPLVITVSELEKLSDEDKQAFRAALGTVTSDPS